MPKFKVLLQQTRVEFTSTVVTAATVKEAMQLAEDRAGNLDWCRSDVIEGTLEAYEAQEVSGHCK